MLIFSHLVVKVSIPKRLSTELLNKALHPSRKIDVSFFLDKPRCLSIYRYPDMGGSPQPRFNPGSVITITLVSKLFSPLWDSNLEP